MTFHIVTYGINGTLNTVLPISTMATTNQNAAGFADMLQLTADRMTRAMANIESTAMP